MATSGLLLSPSALIVFLGRASRDELHRAGDLASSLIPDQEMNIVGRDDVIEHTQPKPFRGLKQPLPPAPAVTREFQEKRTLMTPVRDMPDVMGKKIAMGARHDASSVKRGLGPQTCAL